MRGIFVFNFRLLSSLRFHENASLLFCIFDIFNNYGLKSRQKNTGEAVLSQSYNLLFKTSLEWKIKEIIDSLKHLFNNQLKTKERRMACEGYLFSISDSCLHFVSMKTHHCYFAYLTYLIITAWSPDKRTLEKLYSHVARVTIKNRNLNSKLRVGMGSPL